MASNQTVSTATTAMNVLRRRINPETFIITRRQLAKYLKTDPAEFGVGKSGSKYFGCIFKALAATSSAIVS
jgi:hypothetical protein